MKKYRIDEITINLDNKRKPLNNKERKAISKFKLYPYYGANNIVDYVDEYIFDEEILCVAEDGGSWGYNEECAYIVNQKCWVNNHAHVLKAKNNLNIRYLSYYLNFKNLSNVITGTTRGKLTKSALNSIEILLPELNKQDKIVEILEKSKELMDKRKEQIEALDELVKSKFIDMFGNVNINSKGWNITSMDELIDVIGGYAFKSTEFIDKGVPVLKIGNINAGYFKPTNLMFWKKDDKLEKYLIKPDDLVISLTGTVGKDDYGNVCIMGDDYEEYYLNQRNAKLEIKSNELLNKYYLTYLLKVPEIKQRIIGISRGVRQANIANKDILNLEVPNPPIELQKQFAYFVKQVDKLKFEMEKSLKELEDSFNSLMQRAFNGELF